MSTYSHSQRSDQQNRVDKPAAGSQRYKYLACNRKYTREQSPAARGYFSDAFPTYASLGYYPGVYTVSESKKDTYPLEGDNAELRHYVARLARRSRCFSRCSRALCNALRLFFFAFNSRQLYKAAQPHYPAHVFEFVAPRN